LRGGIRRRIQRVSSIPRGEDDVQSFQEKVSDFALVELLVVITVVAKLVALLMPMISNARNMALRVVCSANLPSIGEGPRNYAATYRGLYPTMGDSGNLFEYRTARYGSTLSPKGGPAGFGLLYTTRMEISTQSFYCDQPSFAGPEATATGQYLPALIAQRAPVDWYNIIYGYCYYYHPSNSSTYWGQQPDEPQIQFATSPTAAGNTIVAGDITMTTLTGGFQSGIAPGVPVSNHITTTITPDGGNELFNIGAVVQP
jgi:hypothetical protein